MDQKEKDAVIAEFMLKTCGYNPIGYMILATNGANITSMSGGDALACLGMLPIGQAEVMKKFGVPLVLKPVK